MFKLLFLLFVLVPIIEIFLLIEVGSRIGALNTIVIILLTALVGTVMLRMQGLSTIARVQQSLEQKRLPASELIEGLMLLVTGALLLTPGFFTDTIGFLCLIPGVRIPIANAILQHFIQSRTQHTPNSSDEIIIEGEFWEEHKPLDDNDKLIK